MFAPQYIYNVSFYGMEKENVVIFHLSDSFAEIVKVSFHRVLILLYEYRKSGCAIAHPLLVLSEYPLKVLIIRACVSRRR